MLLRQSNTRKGITDMEDKENTWTTMNRLYLMVADGVWQFYTTCYSCSPCMQLHRHISVMHGYYKITTTCWEEYFMLLSWTRLMWS